MANSLSKRIVKNISWLGISEILIAGSGFLFTFFIAKQFTVEAFGQFNYALVLATTLGMFIELGLTRLVAREVSLHKNQTKKYLITSITIRCISLFPTAGILLAINGITGTETATSLITYILLGHIALLHISASFNSVYRAHEKTVYETIGKMVNAISIISGIGYIALFNGTVYEAAWIYLVSALLPIFIHIYLFNNIPQESDRFTIDLHFIKNLLKEAWPFALSTIFVFLYYFIDSIFLGIIKGNDAVAFYNIAYKILYVAIIFISFFYSGLFPIATKYAHTEKETYYEILKKTFALIMSFGVLFAIGCFFFADDALRLLFQEKYLGSVTVTQILGINAITIAFNLFLGHLVLDVFKKQKKNTFASGIGAAANIVLNIILIPPFGIIGAAIATIATEILVGIILISMTHIARKASLAQYSIRILLVSIIVFAILYLLNPHLHFILLIAIEFIGFGIMAYLFKLFTKEDYILFKKLFAKG